MNKTITPNQMLAIPNPPLVTVPIVGRSEQFPVRRIYCVGRNYLEHIREMGGDERDPPFFFQKPTDSVVLDGSSVPYPSSTSDFQYEVELVLAIGREGKDIAPEDAASHTFGVSVGIDLTRRDVQVAARKTGRPWEIGKSFDCSAPCGDLIATNGVLLPQKGEIELKVNGEVRQSSDLDRMIWSCAEIISKLSQQYKLMPGDLIYTGTPAGVGPVVPGDKIEARVSGVGSLTISITD